MNASMYDTLGEIYSGVLLDMPTLRFSFISREIRDLLLYELGNSISFGNGHKVAQCDGSVSIDRRANYSCAAERERERGR